MMKHFPGPSSHAEFKLSFVLYHKKNNFILISWFFSSYFQIHGIADHECFKTISALNLKDLGNNLYTFQLSDHLLHHICNVRIGVIMLLPLEKNFSFVMGYSQELIAYRTIAVDPDPNKMKKKIFFEDKQLFFFS